MAKVFAGAWRWRFLHGLYAALILVVSSVPSSDLPQEVALVSDKLLHFGEYLVLGLLGGWAYLRYKPSLFLLLLGFGLAFSGLDEYWQSHVSGRNSDIFDFLADVAGYLTGIIIVSCYCKTLSRNMIP